MRNFLFKSFLFFIIFLVLNFGVHLAFRNYDYFVTYGYKPSEEFRKILFADSRGYSIGDKCQSDGVYNFSAVSESYIDIKRKLRYLIRVGNPLDTVFLTVDDHTLSSYREQSNNMDRSVRYTTSTDFNSYYDFFKERIIRSNLPLFQPKVAIFCKMEIVKFLKGNVESNSESRPQGWEYLPDSTRRQRVSSRIISQFPNDKRSGYLECELIDIINICKNEKIVLIGLKFPLTKEYLDELGSMSYGADSVLISYGAVVEDYSDIFVDFDHFFKNEDHLNEYGADSLVKHVFQFRLKPKKSITNY